MKTMFREYLKGNSKFMSRKLILGISLIAFSQVSYAQTTKANPKTTTSSAAQTPYEKIMTDKIAKIQDCKTPEDYTTLANDFARIGVKETTQWLPNYYSAFSTIQKGRILMRGNKVDGLDAVADEAQKYLDNANALSKDNAELLILTKMIHSLRMMVNPQERYMSEGMLAADALSKAEKLDPTNPRITILKAEDTFYTPEQFGGSKTKGLELFKKAKSLFAAYKTKTTLDPNWGEAEANYFLSQTK